MGELDCRNYEALKIQIEIKLFGLALDQRSDETNC